MRPRRTLFLAALTSLFLLAPPSHAELEVREFVQALGRAQARGKFDASASGLPRALAGAGEDRTSVVIELPAGTSQPAHPFVRVAEGFATLVAPQAEILRLSEAHPDWRISLGPPRYPLMDKADTWIHAASFREQTGNAGSGVLIGIIDTGIDPNHGDLRNADGTSRIRWTIDFSRRPEGLHPELEREYGCDLDEASQCAIFDNADLDALRDNTVAGDEPRDTFGHGTHVASLAAGNGLSQSRAYYKGVAPEAQLIAARVTRASGGSILDSDILRAARFIFDRATELGMPAVVNLSLGSDFGAHDGSSALEQALAAMVGPEHPGRAIVVAAGNSGALYTTDEPKYPEPLGIHTEVHVPRESPTRVPLVTLSAGADSAAIFLWIGFQAGDDLSVGLDDKDGEWIPLVEPGEATTFDRGAYQATIFNGSKNDASPVPKGNNSAVVILQGSWPVDGEFSIRLEGHGTASLWVQSEGGLDPESSASAVLPRGEKQGTINIPGSHPELIAVGATLNRKLWIDHRNFPNEITVHGSIDDVPNDTPAYFSSAGPNALGLMKPDIVAPGVYLIGAMSKLADPRKNGHEGVFASLGRCGEVADVECYVVDDAHAVSSGTSMAAPLVSGAVALLFARDPTLTQDGVRALLQAGARQPTGIVLDEQQVGPGGLDMEGTLAVQISESSPINRVPSTPSWLALATSFAHPDPNWPLVGLVELRDESAQIADGFDSRRLRLEASPAVVLEPLTRIAPGLWRFQVAGPEGSGGELMQLKVWFDDVVLLERAVPIGVDRWAAEERPSARGGCGLSATAASTPASLAALLALLVAGRVFARGRSRSVR